MFFNVKEIKVVSAKALHIANRFNFFVFAFVLSLVIHLFFLFRIHSLPFPVLYGPLLYGMFLEIRESKHRKWLFIHFLPFVLFLIWNIRLNFEFYWPYFEWYLPAMAISVSSYPIFALVKLTHKSVNAYDPRVILLKQMSGYGVAIAALIGLLMASQLILLTLDINPLHLVGLAMFFAAMLLIHFLYAHHDVSTKLSQHGITVTCATWHNNELIQLYENRLNEAMAKQLFLNARLTVDDLAEATDIPKAHLADYFRIYQGQSFYQWLAQYRIQHAQQLLGLTSKLLKIEVVAKESGFQSKTSFNKYFKDALGMSPSAYRQEMWSN